MLWAGLPHPFGDVQWSGISTPHESQRWTVCTQMHMHILPKSSWGTCATISTFATTMHEQQGQPSMMVIRAPFPLEGWKSPISCSLLINTCTCFSFPAISDTLVKVWATSLLQLVNELVADTVYNNSSNNGVGGVWVSFVFCFWCNI